VLNSDKFPTDTEERQNIIDDMDDDIHSRTRVHGNSDAILRPGDVAALDGEWTKDSRPVHYYEEKHENTNDPTVPVKNSTYPEQEEIGSCKAGEDAEDGERHQCAVAVGERSDCGLIRFTSEWAVIADLLRNTAPRVTKH
jgi:hypothetical protein